MIKRCILQDLTRWKNSSRRKPLVLRGARQVGKTTIIREFSKQFDQYIELNLEKNTDKNLFDKDLDIEELIQAICLQHNKPRNHEKTTLLFIDEIQQSKTAVEMLRYFYEQAKDIYVVAAGSLLETLLDYHTTFPVGRVEYLYMYPLSFEEFLVAIGEQESLNALQQVPIGKYAHNKLLTLFHQYSLIGGMPEIINHYIAYQDLVALTPVYRNLLTTYMDDVEKYAKNESTRNIIRHVIRTAPYESGKRIKFVGFGDSGYRSDSIKEAIITLEKAMLMKLSYPVTAITPPAIPQFKKSPKLYFLDIGLVNFAAGLQSYFFGIKDLHNIHNGLIAEQIVAQEFRMLDFFNNGELFFWVREKKQSNAEIDFIIPFKQYLIPIEVKSGKSGTIRSIHQYMDMANHPYAIRLHANNLSVEKIQTSIGKKFFLLNLPYYLSSKIKDYAHWLTNNYRNQ